MMIENWDQYKDLEYYPDRFCACGCKERIKVQEHHKYKGMPRFISGHNTKTKEGMEYLRQLYIEKPKSTESNKKRSEALKKHHEEHPETAEKIMESRRNNGRPWFSKETIEKIKKGNEGKVVSEITRKKIANTLEGHIVTEETKQKLQKFFGGDTYVGENNPNWRGGVSFDPYPPEWTEELRESIRIRDERVCQLCGKTEEQENRKLSVHHIDHDKNNCGPCNLITLCNSCNNKVNFNRRHWIRFFRSKLELVKSGKKNCFA